MSKKLKLLMSLSLIGSGTILPTIALMSADPKIDPNFDKFKEKAEQDVKETIKEAVDKIIKFLEEEKEKVDKTEIKTPKDIEKKIYIEQLVKYYTANKDKIKEKPEDYGFKMFLPYAISKHKKLIVAKVEYKGKVYENIKVSQEEFEKLKEAIKPDGKIEKLKEIDNVLSKKNFDEILQKYTSDLLKKINNIVYQEGDIPNLNFRFEFKDNKWQLVYDEKPKDFNSWDDYIKSKVVPRFNEFELGHNQEAEIKGDEKEEKPEKVPLVPGDKPKPVTKEDIDSLPSLNPLIDPDYTKKTMEQLKNDFSLANSEKMFFFNNPVNTRYLYKVEELSIEGGKLIAKITIADKVKPDLKRNYKVELKIDNSEEFNAEQVVLKAQIDEIKSIYNKFFKSLNLDDKIDYDDLGNDNLQQTLFNMVDLATKLVNIEKFGEPFKNAWKAQTNNFKQQLVKSKDKAKITNLAREEIKKLFLSALLNSKLTLNYEVYDKDKPNQKDQVKETYDYWASMAKAFERVTLQFAKSLKTNKAIIESNFKNNKSTKNQTLKLSVLEDLYAKIEKDIFRLKGIASEKPISLDKWYEKYIELIGKIKNEFNLLRDLGTIKNLDVKTPRELVAFKEAYDKAQTELTNLYISQNKLKIIFGSILMTISLISTIMNVAFMLMKYKTNKKRKIIIVYALIITISLILMISGITLLTLGIKGI